MSSETRTEGALDLNPDRMPAHVGIIMDGNGRWAQARGLPRTEGHRAGAENLRAVLQAAGDLSIHTVTVYAFSTENWSRPRPEVRALMMLARNFLQREIDELDQRGVRVRILGRRAELDRSLARAIEAAEEKTRNNTAMTVNVAFNYGGRADIVDAVREIVRAGIRPEDIDEETISAHLSTADQPDPDLIIRTAGEMRLSNFMIWQAAYAEFYSTPTLWPDFDRTELIRAIQAFQSRHRRFGGLEKTS